VRSIIILILLTILAAASGCGSDGSGSSGKKEVAASFYPLAFAAEELGGDDVHVVNLTPPGTEPHDLEPTPSDVRELKSADLVLLLGHGFQPQLEDAAGSGGEVVELLDTPGLNRFENDDPHVWLDPTRYELIARRIGEELGAPTSSVQRFVAKLKALDREYRRRLDRCARDDIVTSHEAFGYLAQRYGLHQIPITGLSPEAEPSPKDLSRVVGLVRSTHATTVFFETLVSPRIAKAVASETGAHTSVLNPIEGLEPAEAKSGEDYFSLMRSNLASLRGALGCR
jgi:zinc transport system substrate-binding protein